jgi:hypothetical protein
LVNATPQVSVASAPPALPWGFWWAASTVWWGLQFVTTLLLDRGTQGGMPAQLLRANAASTTLWVALTVLIFWLAERAPIDRNSWRWSAPLALAAAGGVVLVRALAVTILNPVIGWYAEQPPFSTVLLTSFGNNFFLFWLVLGAGHGLAYARRVRERDEQLAVAELHHLKAQLHPHFLFNTLNTISTFVRTEPETAVQMIAQLGTLLRHALQRAGAQEVALEEELAIVGVYLDIERHRFDERLRVSWRIDPAVLRARVPHLLLQPLVENAIRHGIAPARDGGTVQIRAGREGEQIRLVVQDDGVSTAPPPAHLLGIGLTNTRRRLQQLYGNAHAFDVVAVQPHGLCITIAIPYREFTRVPGETATSSSTV